MSSTRRAVPIALFAAMIAVSCGGGSGSAGGGVGNNQNITVTVAPVSASVALNGTVQYTATVAGTTNTAVTWSAGGIPGGNSSVGTISSAGLYTAPAVLPNPSAVNIVATSVADTTKSGSATANVIVHHDNQDPQNAPIKLGTSGGNATDKVTSGRDTFCCSGTLGSLISRGGNSYILSNNHVLDKSGQGAIGDPISQPGLADTNCGTNPSITVANLTQAVPLPMNGTGTVDAAMAQIVASEVDTSGTILDLAAVGQPAAPSAILATANLNSQTVAKSGDATGLTCSTVNGIDVAVRVSYSTQCQGGTTFTVTFDHQISIQGANFSNNGDSGSLIVTADTARPLALLYAGSSTGTVGNPIQDVLTALKDPNSQATPTVVGGVDHAVACPAATQTQATAREKVLSRPQLPDSEVSRAIAAKNQHSIELMQDPAVTGVGVGQSDDNPAESAIVVFLKDQPRFPIPAQIEGVRTKIVPGAAFRAEQTAAKQQALALPNISKSEVSRVRATKEQHAQELMSNPAILGVGVGASSDSPGQAAMVVFVEQGKSVSVPVEIDGARTRVITTDPFRTFDWGKRTHNSCATSGTCSACKAHGGGVSKNALRP